MKTGSSVLDASALLAFLKDEPGSEEMESLLGAAEKGTIEVFMNHINLGEVYYVLAREHSPTAAESFFQEDLPLLPIRDLPNSFAEVIAAAQLNTRFGLHYLDAFAAATAIREKAVLVTCDPDFRKVENHLEIRWLR